MLSEEIAQTIFNIPLVTLEATTITLIASIILPMTIVILLSFLPAIIELKKPQDAGPKFIHPALKTVFLTPSPKLIDTETPPLAVITVPKFSTIFPVSLVNIET